MTPSKNIKEEIYEEALRLEKGILYSEESNFILANYWNYANTLLGVSIITFSVVSGGFAFTDFTDFNILIGVLTIFITAISMIQIFLNPHEKSSFNHNTGTRYSKLRSELRIFYNSELDMNSDDENIKRLKKFNDEKNRIDIESTNLPGFIYNKAKKNIEKKEYDYL